MFNLSEKSRAVNDLVIIRNCAPDPNRYMRYGLYLPEAIENTKLVKGVVTSAGPLAIKDGIVVGDTVLYDKHSIFSSDKKGYDTEGMYVITKSENVIAKVVSEIP